MIKKERLFIMQNRAIKETSLIFTTHKADLWTKGFIFDNYVIDLPLNKLNKNNIHFTFHDGKFSVSGQDTIIAVVYKANRKIMDIQFVISFQTEWLLINYDKEKIYKPAIEQLEILAEDSRDFYDETAFDDYNYIKSYLRNIRKDVIDLEIETSNLKTIHTCGI